MSGWFQGVHKVVLPILILFVCLFVYLFVCLFVYLFVCLFVCLFACLDAMPFGNAYFGEGSGLVINLDDVTCIGNEERIVDCAHSGPGIHNCGHAEDAGVRCMAATLPPLGNYSEPNLFSYYYSDHPWTTKM